MRTDDTADRSFSPEPFDDLAAIYCASRTSKIIISILFLLILLATLGISIFLLIESFRTKDWLITIVVFSILAVFSFGIVFAWRSLVRRQIAVHPNWFEVRGAFYTKRFKHNQIGYVQVYLHEIQGITEHTAVFRDSRGKRLCKATFYFGGRWEEIEGWIRATFPDPKEFKALSKRQEAIDWRE